MGPTLQPYLPICSGDAVSPSDAVGCGWQVEATGYAVVSQSDTFWAETRPFLSINNSATAGADHDGMVVLHDLFVGLVAKVARRHEDTELAVPRSNPY